MNENDPRPSGAQEQENGEASRSLRPDEVCEHGTAMDVHCCNCHSGFRFGSDECVCTLTGCVMDYPEAWAYIRQQHPDPAEHDPACSWVQAQGGILCDCAVLWEEYERRKNAIEEQR